MRRQYAYALLIKGKDAMMFARLVFVVFSISVLSSCTTVGTVGPGAGHITNDGLRTIVLKGEEYRDVIKEDETQKFVEWKCSDYFGDGPVLVEVGIITDTESSESDFTGFILFDGSNSGELAFHRRTGLEQVWNWGSELKYQFSLKPDGKGYYYDFTGTEEGEKVSSSQSFSCRKSR